MNKTNVHVVAMTGSYFRGDRRPILLPEDESKFTEIVYTYYEQLNGYKYMKYFNMAYHFYDESYIVALGKVLDTNKKTIIHIPNVNSRESTEDKYDAAIKIIELIGDEISTDEHGVKVVKSKDGRVLRIADLVQDQVEYRKKIKEYLANISNKDDIDIIIALGMAKEGFDWEYCEHAITIGHRSSFTEVVQIIGRCTRDSEGKESAAFSHIILNPESDRNEIVKSVNDCLKTIACSLLMKQVMKEDVKFIYKKSIVIEENKSNSATITEKDIRKAKTSQIYIEGMKRPNERVQELYDATKNDFKAKILQNIDKNFFCRDSNDITEITRHKLHKLIELEYPELKTTEEIEQFRHLLLTEMVIKGSRITQEQGKEFITFLNGVCSDINELNIDLIESVNPFQEIFNTIQAISKDFSAESFKLIMDELSSNKELEVTNDEAIRRWPDINKFYDRYKKLPDFRADDKDERRLATILHYVKKKAFQNKGSSDDFMMISSKGSGDDCR